MKSVLKKYKNDIFLIGGILLCAGILWAVLALRSPGAYVRIEKDSETLRILPLNEDCEIWIPTVIGEGDEIREARNSVNSAAAYLTAQSGVDSATAYLNAQSGVRLLTAFSGELFSWITGDGKDGNLVVIHNGKVHVENSSCPDKTCEHQGEKSAVGDTIVCLPHRLVVTVISAEEAMEAKAEMERMQESNGNGGAK